MSKMAKNLIITNIIVISMLYLLLSFLSVSFNIADWREGCRFAFVAMVIGGQFAVIPLTLTETKE